MRPAILYGTAWKEDATAELVTRALAAGFRGVDTANQRKHYHEAGVGQALAAALAAGTVRRAELFVQTKFTFAAGQDARLPYDPAAPIATQVAQSFARSREHLGLTDLDSLVLHGPSRATGLGPDDHAAWRAMEALVDGGHVGALGVSNVSAEQLRALLAFARVRPTYVQNRCYAERGWDRLVRAECAAADLVYQPFSLLTANRAVLARPALHAIAMRHDRTVAQVIFRFAQQMTMLPLTGTTSAAHMADDLGIADLELSPTELAEIDRLGATA